MKEAEQKEMVRERFTRTAEVFGSFAVKERAREAEKLADMLGVRGDERVADLACGPGTLALRFAPRVRWISGVDFTPAMLMRARQSAREMGIANLALTMADAHALPFASASLGLAITSYSLHHMSDAGRVISEMARVLRPAGRAGVIDVRGLEERERWELAQRIEKARDPSHTRSLPPSEFARLFAAAGFRLMRCEAEDHPRSFDHWLSVAGWKRGDARYEETRRLMESTVADDLAGFHPRLAPGGGSASDARPDIAMVNTVVYVIAEKIGG